MTSASELLDGEHEGDPISLVRELEEEQRIELLTDLLVEVNSLDKRLGKQDRQIAILTRTMRALLGLDEVTDLADFIDAAAELADHLDGLEAVPEAEDTPTKVQLCREVAASAIRRRSDNYGSAAAVTTELVGELVEDRYEIAVENATIHDAFAQLAGENDHLSVEKGRPGPHTEPTKLVASPENVEATG